MGKFRIGGLAESCFLLAGIIMVAIVILLMMGCKSVEYVPVVENHDVHHWHSDSVHQRDSVIRETQTTIMQLDSTAMAQYGIHLKSAERAWLVKTAELERQIERLMAMTSVKDSIHDSIPYPVPVEVVKEVKKPMNGFERAMFITGIVAIMLLLLFIVSKIKTFLP